MSGMLFPSGAVVMTRGIEAELGGELPLLLSLLRRHLSGDWGDLGASDRDANRDALTHGGRILSAYDVAGRSRVWIITEGDRSSTCILLPDEY